MIQALIFSKNRALQCDLLLRSIRKYFYCYEKYSFTVLYTSTNDRLERGYEKIKSLYPEFKFVREIDFKTDVLRILDNPFPYTMFMTDDDIFKDNFSVDSPEFLKFATSKDILTLSLRLGKHITFCYSENIETVPPTSMLFKWRNYIGDWGYPASVDCNIFNTIDIYPLIKNLSFSNPNNFESSLVSAFHTSVKEYMLCYDSSKVINIPINRVQNVYNNRSANISVDMLNDHYLNSYQIILEDFHQIQNKSVHQEIKLRLQKQNA